MNEYDKRIAKDRMIILQNFVETYLKLNNMPPSGILFNGTEDSFGELNEVQARMLHLYLEDSYKRMGFDLKKAIEDSGEEYVHGKLSQYEVKELIRRADEMIVFIGVLELRKKADDEKKQKKESK